MVPPGSKSSQQVSNGTVDSKRVKVIDGGFATQLGCHIQDPIDGDPLWSARYLVTEAEAVIMTHLDFLRAGADIIMTNTYQASIPGFMHHLHLSEEESRHYIKKAVDYAREAVGQYLDEFSGENERPNKPLIAGAVGPYGASLHDGSEYTGSYANNTSPETMREWHRPRIEALIEAGVDILALETIPCRVEAEMLVELIKDYPDVKAWLTFSCRQDAKCNSFGEDFTEAVRTCFNRNPEQLLAVGANCLAPRLVEPLFRNVNKGRENNPVPLIVYPNSGENYVVELGWIDRDKCEPLDNYIAKWLDLGITWVGGCCRTYASDVARIKNEVKKWERRFY